MSHRITFYTRERCSLCDKAKAVVDEVRQQHHFDLVVLDLDKEASPEKLAAYTHEVPVVELDGRKIMKYQVDEARLVRLLTL